MGPLSDRGSTPLISTKNTRPHFMGGGLFLSNKTTRGVMMNNTLLTIFSIIISGTLSWGISAFFFRKGNRISLQTSVLFPLLSILAEPFSKNNYIEIKNISQNPLIRFFTKDEKNKFFNLIKEYKNVYPYNENSVNATAIVLDVESRLKKSGINPKNKPCRLDNNNYEYFYPDEINDLQIDIEKVFKRDCWEFEIEDCTDQIFLLVNNFTQRVYNKRILESYKDYNITTIIQNSETTNKWNQKFDSYYAAKQEFEALKLVTKTRKSLK